jgi:hypothetical protein
MRCIAKKSLEGAAQAHAQAIIQLKNNQPALVQSAEAACASQYPTSSDTRSPPHAIGVRPGQLTYSARHAQSPTPNGNS